MNIKLDKMKNCPYCKKPIIEGDDICPYCHRVIVERINTQNRILIQENPEGEKITQDVNIDYKKSKKIINWKKVGKYVGILVLVFISIFIVVEDFYITPNLVNHNSINHPTQSLKKNPIKKFPLNGPVSLGDDILNVKIKPNNTSNNSNKNLATSLKKNRTTRNFSLNNCTILSKDHYYLNGLGELKIKNGTMYDAVVKLVNTTINKSIYTVFIRAQTSYSMLHIADGYYKLFFSLGNGWNNDAKVFSSNSTYSVFENLLSFKTKKYQEGNYLHTKYSSFEVTLNPVFNGNAKTDKVSPGEFANY